MIGVKRGASRTMATRLVAAVWLSIAILCLAFSFGRGGSANAAEGASSSRFPETPIQLSYEIWFGGFNVAAAEAEFILQDGAYTLRSIGETKGMAALLAEWRGEVLSQGRISDSGDIQPAAHRQNSEWRGEERRVTLDYDALGEMVSYSVEPERDPEDEDEINPLPPNPEIGTIDPLSVIAGEAAFSTAGFGCNAVYPVFDGRRRYDLTLTDKGETIIEPSEYTVFSGTVQACEVTFKMLGGDRKEKSKYAKTARNRTIFLGQPLANGPVVPVRMRIETDYGLLIAHLTGFAIGDQKLALNED